MEIDTWVGASEKNGMRRDWLIRSQATGHVFARATRYFLYRLSIISLLYINPTQLRLNPN